jgi:hypothetical protein
MKHKLKLEGCSLVMPIGILHLESIQYWSLRLYEKRQFSKEKSMVEFEEWLVKVKRLYEKTCNSIKKNLNIASHQTINAFGEPTTSYK